MSAGNALSGRSILWPSAVSGSATPLFFPLGRFHTLIMVSVPLFCMDIFRPMGEMDEKVKCQGEVGG